MYERDSIFMLQLLIGNPYKFSFLNYYSYSPWVLLIIPFVITIWAILLRKYMRTYRELSRLQSVNGTPLISHLGETLNGVSTIRAFKKEQDFINKNIEYLNTKLNVNFWKDSARRWFSIRITLTSISVFIFTWTFWVSKFENQNLILYRYD